MDHVHPAVASARPLTVLNLGLGTQSTALALMSAWGLLPRIDAAVFADTGDEPAAVYEVGEAVEAVLGSAGIPLHRVAHGSLAADVLDPHTQAAIPAFTLGEREVRRPLRSSAYTCPDCGGAGWADRARREATGAAWAGTHGGGDAEPPAAMCPPCGGAGVRHREFAVERRPTAGRLPRRCTPRYKAEVIDRLVRELLGAPVRVVDCRYCAASGSRVPPWDPAAGRGPCSVCRGTGRRRRVGSVPAGARVTQWIGFSAEEEARVDPTTFPAHATPRYPLIEMGWTRADCADWLAAHGWPAVKSACLICPFRSDEGWRRMRDERPEEFARAVAFDHAFRTAPGLRARRFLHSSRVPLDQAPLDRVGPRQWGRRQLSLLDAC